MTSILHTRFCRLVGVQYPIVQTGMGWVSGARLTAATSEAGGLGILGSATLTLAELEERLPLRPKCKRAKPAKDAVDPRIGLPLPQGN